jgi:Protein of unknown function (DUF1475)
MMTNLFRAFLFIAWLACIGTTLYGTYALGFATMLPYFMQGYRHPWGAAITIDFTFHVLASSLWLVWTAKTVGRGVVYGLLAFCFGGSFTFAYLLVQSFKTTGDLKAVALGRQLA